MKASPLRYVNSPARTLVTALGLILLMGCQPSDSGTVGATGDEIQPPRVALLQYADSPLYAQGVGGMIEGLEAQGFVDGDNLQLTRYDAKRSPQTAGTMAREIIAGNFDLVLTAGTPALQEVAKANQDGSTVQVFGLVANPFNAGVGLNADDFLDHPAHLVGVGSFPPVDPVFHLALELYPDLKVVGVVWNAAESNSVEGTELAREVCSTLGIELLEANVTETSEVGDAAGSLVAQGAQVLWIGADNTAHHAADSVIAAARAGRIPVMSSLPGDAARGALFDLSLNWNDVGKAVGRMAGEILAGTDPRTIAIMVHPNDLRLVLNEAALEGLTAPWTFPAEVVQRSEELIN